MQVHSELGHLRRFHAGLIVSYSVAGWGISGVNAIQVSGYFLQYNKLLVAVKDGILWFSQLDTMDTMVSLLQI